MPVDKLSIHSSTNFTESLSDASHCMVIISETNEDSSGIKWRHREDWYLYHLHSLDKSG